jgi:hypothetical protein
VVAPMEHLLKLVELARVDWRQGIRVHDER